MVEIEECIVLDDREYICFDKASLDGKEYLYLVTIDEPNEIRFAEIAPVDGEPQVRVIGNRAEKQKLLAHLQEKAKANQNNQN